MTGKDQPERQLRVYHYTPLDFAAWRAAPLPRQPLQEIDGDSFAHRSYHALPKTILRRGGKPADAIVGFFDRDDFRHRHVFDRDDFRHRRFFVSNVFIGGYPYYYGGCYWLRRQAIITGSPYWWGRYEACRGYY